MVGTNGQVYAIATLAEGGGDLVLGGTFTIAGNMPAMRVARFSPATNAWSTLGGGIPGANGAAVNAVAVVPGGDIIAGGSFSVPNGAPANYIARYNALTNAWTPLGSGVNGSVLALTVLQGGDLIVGGNFSMAGGGPASNIARYNPTTNAWSALGSGVSSVVSTLLALPGPGGGDVLVGGQFLMAGTVTVNRVARYTTSANIWSPLGSGVSSLGPINVFALGLLPSGDFLVGGLFMTAGGVPASNIARFSPDGNLWSSLGSGTSGAVQSFAMLPGGDVIVGGGFSTAGGVSSQGIVRCNPVSSEWTRLGSGGLNGPSQFCRALALTASGDLILGGDTTGGGSVQLNGTGIARFTLSNGCISDFNCSGGQPTVQDVFDFLAAWFANEPAANINGAGGITVQDIFDFLAAYFAGCA